MELSNAELSASWSEVEGDGERSMRQRSYSAGQWWAVALLRRFWRAEGVKGKAERAWVSGEAAGRRPLQAGQRAAQSGQVERVVATRRQPLGHGRP